MPTLANLYDADLRRTNPLIGQLAAGRLIPHPLRNVEYADGVFMPCTHAKKHARFERCAVPTSCRCGAPWAWVRVEGCKEYTRALVGCVCHHTPADDRSHSEGSRE